VNMATGTRFRYVAGVHDDESHQESQCQQRNSDVSCSPYGGVL
jgi:hypothetical protein